LEDGLTQEYLININDFSKNVINEEIYLVLKGLLTTNEKLENHTAEKNKDESISANGIENNSEKYESKANKSTVNEERIEKWQVDILDALNSKFIIDKKLFFLKSENDDDIAYNKKFMEDVASRGDFYMYLDNLGLVNRGFCPITGENIDESYSFTMFQRKVFLSEKGMSICNEIKKNEYDKRNISNFPYEKMVQKGKNMKSIFRVLSSIISFYLSYQFINPSGIFSILFFLILGAVLIPIIEFLLIFLYANLKGLIRKK
jgi:hypothetical protein